MNAVKIFKALADETRLEMVKYLSDGSEKSCQEMSTKFKLSQPALSHHFGKLIDSGVFKVRKEGVSNFYSMDENYLKSLGLNPRKIIKNS